MPQENDDIANKSGETTRRPEGFIDAASQMDSEDSEDTEYMRRAEAILAAKNQGPD